jgi:ectoine hydroxylase-related dioxygenase (phytanoyl-CoA dioxygenase family)
MHDAQLAGARPVSDDEVTFYRDNGWVKLEKLVEPDLVAEMLAVSKELLGEHASAAPRAGVDAELDWFNDRHFLARDGREPFRSLCLSEAMGANAERLLERPVPIRFYSDMLACKLPAAGGFKSAATMAHQDLGQQFDRIGKTTFWLALDDVPPERGSMRFWSGSHKEGPLGNRSPHLFSAYPYLRERYELSAPVYLQPGDATVHHQMVIHEAPANTTDTPRWSYIFLYFPADALYSGRPSHGLEGLELEMDQPFEHPNFPVVYSPRLDRD